MCGKRLLDCSIDICADVCTAHTCACTRTDLHVLTPHVALVVSDLTLKDNVEIQCWISSLSLSIYNLLLSSWIFTNHKRGLGSATRAVLECKKTFLVQSTLAQGDLRTSSACLGLALLWTDQTLSSRTHESGLCVLLSQWTVYRFGALYSM